MLLDILLVVGTFILGIIVTLVDIAARIIVSSNELGEYREEQLRKHNEQDSHGL